MEQKKDIYEKATSNLLVKLFIALITSAATIVTIYAFFQEKKIDLQYAIISNTNVLDIKAEVSKLDILYDSTSLKEKKENLRLVNIKVINKGSKHILKDYFDENDPLGLKIDSGKILENPEIIETSNDYLKRNIKYNLPSDCSITFSEIIIESGEYFILKLLILHKINEEPQISPLGKIAGQKEIMIKLSSEVKEEIPFLKAIFYGNVWVQITRLVLYFIIIVLIVALIVYLTEKSSDIKQNKRRKKLIKEFKQQKDYQYSRMDDAIFDRFYHSGAWILKKMSDLTSDAIRLNKKYKDALNTIKEKDTSKLELDRETSVIRDKMEDIWTTINSMLSDGLVFKEADDFAINQKMRMTLDKFIFFLKEKKEFEKHRYFGGSDIIIEENNENQ